MSKISSYGSLSSPADGDLLIGVDVSDTTMASTGTDKKLTLATLKGYTGGTSWLNAALPPYSADPTGTNDSTTAIQDAINAAAVLGTGGGVVYLPAGTYLVSTALAPASGVRITGDGRLATKITATASSVLNMGGSTLIDGAEIDHLTLSVTGYDLITGANVARCSIHDCGLVQNSAGHSIWGASSVTLLLECRFERNREDVYGATRTVAAWYLDSSSNSQQVNQNLWADSVCTNNDADNTQYWYQVVSSGASTFNQANQFRDIVFENPLGGMIDLQSHLRGTIENCLAYDTSTTIAQNLIYLRKNSSSSIGTRGTTVTNSGRIATSETLGSGVYDIACDSNCEQTTIIAPVRSAAIDTGGSTAFKVISQGGTPSLANAAATATAAAGTGTSPPSPVATAGPTNETGSITWGTGTSPPSAPSNQVNVTFGTPFSVTPAVMINSLKAANSALGVVSVANVTKTGFTITVSSAPAASQANTTYGVNWIAVA